MRGDIDGDGMITSNDANILSRHVGKIQYITDETALLTANVNGDGKVDSEDLSVIGSLTNGTALIGAYGEITGNWTSNPNYETEEYQFYTDIAISSMTVSSSATITIKGASEHYIFRAECLDGAIRIYVNLCPISELKAIVQYGAGNGTAIVVCEDTDLSRATSTATITIPAAIMYGDVDRDGLITEKDVKILSDHVDGTELITGVKFYIADVDVDNSITSNDVAAVSNVVTGASTANSLGVYNGDWMVVTNLGYVYRGMNFYIDIPVNGITANSSATISMQDSSTPNLFAGECLDGAIRIYAKWCPRYEIKAVVQYGAGDGTAIIIYKDVKDVAITLGILSASSWADNTYSFESTYPIALYDIEISVDSSATEEQFTAFSDALICGSYNSNIITAKGTVPTVDIPIIIKVVKK